MSRYGHTCSRPIASPAAHAAHALQAIDSTQLSTVAAFWSGLSLKRFVVDASSNVTVLKYIWRDGTPFDMDSEIARYLQLPSPSNASVGSCIGIDVATGKAIFTSCLSTYFYICKGMDFLCIKCEQTFAVRC